MVTDAAQNEKHIWMAADGNAGMRSIEFPLERVPRRKVRLTKRPVLPKEKQKPHNQNPKEKKKNAQTTRRAPAFL
jgi:hypothetical protein